METIASELRISKTLKKNPPTSTEKPVTAGINIVVYTEKKRQWVGPVIAEVVQEKTVYVRDGKNALKPFSISITKEYVDPNTICNISFEEIRKCFNTGSDRLQGNVSQTFLTEVLA